MLALYKDQFEEDVAILPKIDPSLQLRPLSLFYLKLMFSRIASQPLAGLTESNYHSTEKWDRSKALYYSFLMRTLPIFFKLTGIRGVISCNHNYIAQQELSRACKTLRVPFIVVYKEGMIVPERSVDWQNYYPEHFFSGPINASVIYTANSYVAGWLSNSTAIDNGTELIPVGIPRTDRYKTDNFRDSLGTALVVFAYDPSVSFGYFSEIEHEGSGQDLQSRLLERTVETYSAIVAFARRNPETPVIVKSKPRSLVESAVLPKLLNQQKESGELTNLTLTNSVPAADLIKQSRVVIALNSTTVAEAILSRRKVLTPDFGEFFEGRAWNYFHRFQALFNPFTRPEEIEMAMASYDEVPEDAAIAFVERHLTSDAALASETLVREISRHLRDFEGGAPVNQDQLSAAKNENR
ncbi:MAG: hypothetical protein ACR2PA_03975 [Hyphomicrobiaceae bacterium]